MVLTMAATSARQPPAVRLDSLDHISDLHCYILHSRGTSLRARGVKFHSLTEAIDTATPTGRAMWLMIGVLAELKRSLEARGSGHTGAALLAGQFGN